MVWASVGLALLGSNSPMGVLSTKLYVFLYSLNKELSLLYAYAWKYMHIYANICTYALMRIGELGAWPSLVHIHPLLLLANQKICWKIWTKTLRNRKVQKKLQNSENNCLRCNSWMLFSQLQLHVQRCHNKRRHLCSIRRPFSLCRLLHWSVLHRTLSSRCQGWHTKHGRNASKGNFLRFKTKVFRTLKAENSDWH